jgi:nucleoside-diphosphate-sugar epimerase
MRKFEKILVTGASGFIGLPAAQALVATGADVTCLDLSAPENLALAAKTVIGDFSDPHLVYRLLSTKRIDTIVHIGGISGPMLARDAPFEICKANVIGTMNLLEMARVTGVSRFVYCSSASAYGDTPPAPVPDDAPLQATDIYSASKGAGDLMLRAYRVQHGLDAVSLRISNGYGPRRRTTCALRLMIENALAGKPTHMSWGKGYGRVYLYVDDAVRAIVSAVKALRFEQPAYNIAGSDFMLMEDIARIVKRQIGGASITMEPGDDTLGYRREALDISAAARDLGWRPEVQLEQGIAAYTAWLKDENMPLSRKAS